jgi:hypothetical protein
MKKFSLIMLLLAFQGAALYAQPGPTANPNGKEQAQITLTDNSTLTGELTDNIRKKGEVTLVVNGKKTRFKAGDISSVHIGGKHFITINYTFYEVVYQGKNITLLRKASEPSGLQYNGSDAAVITSEGDIDDLLVKKENGNLKLLTTKNVKELLGNECPAAGQTASGGKLDAESLRKALTDCDSNR